jgi:linoleoyl-CoA desaturase
MLRIRDRHRRSSSRWKPHQREAYRDWATIALLNHAVMLTIVFVKPPLAFSLVAALVLGLGFAMGAITVLHNAGHHRFSQKYWPNMLMVHSAVPTGLWVAHWTLKHRIHHKLPAAYPDDPFTKAGGLLRLHPLAPRYGFHRFQHLYVWFLYPFAWVVEMLSELRYLASGRISGLEPKRAASWRLATFAIEKAVTAVVLLPYFLLYRGVLMLILLCAATLFAGLLVTCVVATGHVNIGIEYPSVSNSERDWATYVVATTASFSTEARFVPWLTGGLTHHLAHHLRPLATRKELRTLHSRMAGGQASRGMKVVEFRTLRAALHGHGMALKQLGTLSVPALAPEPHCVEEMVSA